MCQIEHIAKMGCKEPFTLKLEQFLVATLRKLRIFLIIRKIKKYKTNLACRLSDQFRPSLTKEDSISSAYSTSLQPGDIVRVRSKEQILQTLDNNNRLEGCVFMNEMWQYCESQHKVLKRVDCFFDEAKFRMRKTRHTVLLEGLHCSGKIPGFVHRCDRFCYYFWKESWLEHVK